MQTIDNKLLSKHIDPFVYKFPTFWTFIISIILIGFYVHDCLIFTNTEQHCHNMLIATSFFSAIALFIIFTFIISYRILSKNEQNIIKTEPIQTEKNTDNVV